MDVTSAELTDTAVPGGESPSRHGGEGVTHCLVEAHPAEHEGRNLGSGNEEVDAPQELSGVLDARPEAVRSRPRYLRLEELHPTHTQDRQDGKGEDDDAHAAKPLGQRAPDQDAL